jgi:hypothetical protein
MEESNVPERGVTSGKLGLGENLVEGLLALATLSDVRVVAVDGRSSESEAEMEASDEVDLEPASEGICLSVKGGAEGLRLEVGLGIMTLLWVVPAAEGKVR